MPSHQSDKMKRKLIKMNSNRKEKKNKKNTEIGQQNRILAGQKNEVELARD